MNLTDPIKVCPSCGAALRIEHHPPDSPDERDLYTATCDAPACLLHVGDFPAPPTILDAIKAGTQPWWHATLDALATGGVANITARGETVILVLNDGTEHVIDCPITIAEQLRYATNDAARTRRQRIMFKQRAARVAEWLAHHPNASQISDGRWWDAASFTVLDRDDDRLSPRDLARDSVPVLPVKQPSGRVGHLWTGGPETACRRWMGTDMEPTTAPLCADCARIQEPK